MEILRKLAQLANELDAKGCIDEASAIDEVIKAIAVDWSKIDKHFEGKLNKNISPAHIKNIKDLRVELGLPAEPAVFDRAVAKILRSQYPGVWIPTQPSQKATDILKAVRDMKAKTMDFAGQPGVFEPGGVTIKGPKQKGMDFAGQPGVFEPGGVTIKGPKQKGFDFAGQPGVFEPGETTVETPVGERRGDPVGQRSEINFP